MKQYRSNGLGDNVIVIKRNETFMEDTRFISYKAVRRQMEMFVCLDTLQQLT